MTPSFIDTFFCISSQAYKNNARTIKIQSSVAVFTKKMCNVVFGNNEQLKKLVKSLGFALTIMEFVRKKNQFKCDHFFSFLFFRYNFSAPFKFIFPVSTRANHQQKSATKKSTTWWLREIQPPFFLICLFFFVSSAPFGAFQFKNFCWKQSNRPNCRVKCRHSR